MPFKLYRHDWDSRALEQHGQLPRNDEPAQLHLYPERNKWFWRRGLRFWFDSNDHLERSD